MYKYRLTNAVKYVNCALVTITTDIITMITVLILSIKNGISSSLFDGIILLTVNTCINVFAMHLQFIWMRKCYFLLCEPFRIEINDVINKHLTHIQLSVSRTNNTSTHSPDTVTSSSTVPTGVEPTNSNNAHNSNRLRPISRTSELSNINSADQSRKRPGKVIFLCALCPLVIQSGKP